MGADSPPGAAPGEARRRLAASLQAVQRVLLNPDLRRLQIAWTLATAAEWTLIVALLVYTYERGGTFGVGLLGVARTLPTLIGVPLASTLADRHSRIRVMLGCYLVALATAAVAAIALAADAPLLIVLVIAAVNAVATTAIRPLQNTIIPSLARSPEELVAANVATSTGEGIGVLVGPGLGGILMVFGPAVVAVAGAVGMVLATTAFTQIRDRPVRLRPSANAVGHPGRQPSRSNFVAGVAALRSLPTPFLVMAVFGVQPFVRGVLTVLIVAASIELLGLGDPGVGLLNAAIGAGAIIGAVATILLIGRARLAMVFLGALALWGAPISVVGLLPVAWVAVVAMGVIGSANAVLDVAGFTTLQRTIPNDIRASVLGLFEGYVAAMTGLGGLAAPVLLAVFGIEGALIVTGAILPVLAVLSSRFLVRVDDIALVPERQLRLLRGVAMFAPLPITTIEQLADNLVPVRFVAGEILMRAGDPGDRFILIETGTVEVEQDGATIRSIGPGGSVGEIALLRGVPRTATVRAATDVRAFALESASFIAAVTGDRDAAGFADRVVDARLANAEASTSRS